MAKKDCRTFYDHRMFFNKKSLLPCILFLTSLSSFQDTHAAAAMVAPPPPGFGPKPPPGPIDIPAPPPPQPAFPQVNPAHLPQIIGATGPIQAKVDGHTLRVQHDQARIGMGFSSFNITQNHGMDIHATYGPEALTLLQVSNAARPANIDGFLRSNAGVLLISPNGIVIGPNGVIDTHSLIASTQNLSDYAAFLEGSMAFNFEASTNPMAHIANRGAISVNDAGFAAFVSPGFGNAGIISGNVYVGAGERTDIDLTDDGLIKMRVHGKLKQAMIEQTKDGKIHARGKTVFLTTSDTEKAANNVINLRGEVDASGGEIIVLGGEHSTANVSATLSTAHTEAKGGAIEIGATTVSIKEEATLDASGKTEGGFIRTHAQELNIAGKVLAQGETGQGGYISLFGNQSHIHKTAHIDTFGAPGGTTRLFGDHITVDGGAHFESSGYTEGGTIFIGGYKTGRPMENTPAFQVLGPRSGQTTHHNAHTVDFKRGAMATADSYGGDAGEIYLIAEGGSLTALGSTSVSAFGETGNGGWGEYSILKSNQLIFQKSPLRTSKNGKFGTFHLDPNYINIIAGATSPDDDSNYIDVFLAGRHPLDTFNIGADWIVNEITNRGDLLLEAWVNIVIQTPINAPHANHLLTLIAGNAYTIAVENSITIGDDTHSPGLRLIGRNGGYDKCGHIRIDGGASITVHGETHLHGRTVTVGAPINIYDDDLHFWNAHDVAIESSQPITVHDGNLLMHNLTLRGHGTNLTVPMGALVLDSIQFDTAIGDILRLNAGVNSGVIRLYGNTDLNLESKMGAIIIGGAGLYNFKNNSMAITTSNDLTITANIINGAGNGDVFLSASHNVSVTGNITMDVGHLELRSTTVDSRGSISTPGGVLFRADNLWLRKTVTLLNNTNNTRIYLLNQAGDGSMTQATFLEDAALVVEGSAYVQPMDTWVTTIKGDHFFASVPATKTIRLATENISMNENGQVSLTSARPTTPNLSITAPRGTITLNSPVLLLDNGSSTSNLTLDTGTADPDVYGTISILGTDILTVGNTLTLGEGTLTRGSPLTLNASTINIGGKITNSRGMTFDASTALNINSTGSVVQTDYSMVLKGRAMTINGEVKAPGNLTLQSDHLTLGNRVEVTNSPHNVNLYLRNYAGSGAMPLITTTGGIGQAQFITAGKPIHFDVTTVNGTYLDIEASSQDGIGHNWHQGGSIINHYPLTFNLANTLKLFTSGNTGSIDLNNVRINAGSITLDGHNSGDITLWHSSSTLNATTGSIYVRGSSFTVHDNPTITAHSYFYSSASVTTTMNDLNITAGTYIRFSKLYAHDAENTNSTITLTPGADQKLTFDSLNVHNIHLTRGHDVEFKTRYTDTRQVNIYGSLTSTADLTGNVIFEGIHTPYDWSLDMRSGSGFNSISLPGMDNVLIKENISSFQVYNGTFDMPLTFEGANPFALNVHKATISNDILPAANNPGGKFLTLNLLSSPDSMLTIDGGSDELSFDRTNIASIVTGTFNFRGDLYLGNGSWLQPTGPSMFRGNVIVENNETGRVSNTELLNFLTLGASFISQANGGSLTVYSSSHSLDIPSTGLDGSIFRKVTLANLGAEIAADNPLVLTTMPRTEILELYPRGTNFASSNRIKINADLGGRDVVINTPYTLEIGSNTLNAAAITFNAGLDTRDGDITPAVHVTSDFSATGTIDFTKSILAIDGEASGNLGGITIRSTGGSILSDYLLYAVKASEQTLHLVAEENIDIMQRQLFNYTYFDTFSAHAKNTLSLKQLAGTSGELKAKNLTLQTDARADPANGAQSNIDISYPIKPNGEGTHTIDSGGTVTIDAPIGTSNHLRQDLIIKANKGGADPSYAITVNADENNVLYGKNITIEGSEFNWWGRRIIADEDLSITAKNGSIVLDSNNGGAGFYGHSITSNKLSLIQEGAAGSIGINTPVYGGSDTITMNAEGAVVIDSIVGYGGGAGAISITGKSIDVNQHIGSDSNITLTSTDGAIDIGAYHLNTIGNVTLDATGGNISFDSYMVTAPTVSITGNNSDVTISNIGTGGDGGHSLSITGNNITLAKGALKVRDSIDFTAQNGGNILVAYDSPADQFNFATSVTMETDGGGNITLQTPSFGGSNVLLDAGTGTLNLGAPIGYQANGSEAAITKLTLQGKTINIGDKISAATLKATATGGQIALSTAQVFSIKSNTATFKTLAPATARDGDILLKRAIFGTGDMVIEAVRNVVLDADIGSAGATYNDIKIQAVGDITTNAATPVAIYGNTTKLLTTGAAGDINIPGSLNIRGSNHAELDAQHDLNIGSGAGTGLALIGPSATLRGRNEANLAGDLNTSARLLSFSLTPVINIVGHSTIKTVQGLILNGAQIKGAGANLYNLTLDTARTDFHNGAYGSAAISYPSLTSVLDGSFANVTVSTNGGILMTEDLNMDGRLALTSRVSRITLRDTSLGDAHDISNLSMSAPQGIFLDNVPLIKGGGAMTFTGDITALNVPGGGTTILNDNGLAGDTELRDTLIASDGLFSIRSNGAHNIKLNGVGTASDPIHAFSVQGGITYLQGGGIHSINDVTATTNLRTMLSAQTVQSTTGDITLNGYSVGAMGANQRFKLDAAGDINFNTVAAGANPVTVEVVNGNFLVSGDHDAAQSLTIVGNVHATGHYTYRTTGLNQSLNILGRIIPDAENLTLDMETSGDIAIRDGILANATPQRFQFVRVKPGNQLSIGGGVFADSDIELLANNIRLLSDTEINTARGQILFPAGAAIPTKFNSDSITTKRALTIEMNSEAGGPPPAHNFVVPTLGNTYALRALTINTRAGDISTEAFYPIYVDGDRHLSSTGTITIDGGHPELFRGAGTFTVVTPNAFVLPITGQAGRGALTALDLSGATGGVSVSHIAATESILLPDNTVIRGNSHLSAPTIDIDTADFTILDDYLRFTGDVTLAADADIKAAIAGNLQVSGSLTSPGTLRIRRPITLHGGASFEGTTVTFDEPIQAAGHDLHIRTTTGAANLDAISNVQDFSLTSPVDLVLQSLSGIETGTIQSTGGRIILTEDLMNLKNIDFKSPVVINKAGDMLVDITGTNTRFEQGIDWKNGVVPHKLTIDARGSFDVLQGIGLNRSPEHVILKGSTRLGATLKATNSIVVENATNLIGDTVLHAPYVKTLGTVDGPYGLTIEEGGGYTQGGAIGSGSKLSRFRWDSSRALRIAHPIHATHTRIGTPNMNFGPAPITTDHLHIVALRNAGISIEAAGNPAYPFNIRGEYMRSDRFSGIQRLSIGDPLNLQPIRIEGQFLFPNVRTHFYGNPIVIPVNVNAYLEAGDLIQYVGHIERAPRQKSLVAQMQEHVADAHQSGAEALVHHVEQPDVLPMKIIPHEDVTIDASDLTHDHDAPMSDMGENEEEIFGSPAMAAAAA